MTRSRSGTYYMNKATMREDMNSYGRPWAVGTLRVLYTDERDCWGVATFPDFHYGTAWYSWRSGEVFDGTAWRPIAEGWHPVIRHGRVERVELAAIPKAEGGEV